VDNQRNIIFAVLLTALVLFGWEAAISYLYPQPDKPTIEQIEQAGAAREAPAEDVPAPTREGGLRSATDIALEKKDLKAALSGGGRIPIEAPALSGSINLTGALFDDLTITRHRQSIEKDSGPVRIFSPAGTPAQHFAQLGWVGEGTQLPTAETVWKARDGVKLTPDSPVTITWSNGAGQGFAITYQIDEDYLITAKQTVANTSGDQIVVRPFGLINGRDGWPRRLHRVYRCLLDVGARPCRSTGGRYVPFAGQGALPR